MGNDVLKAIQVVQSSFERTKRRAINSPLLRDPPKVLEDLPNLSYLVSDIDIASWVRQLTAALVYDAIQIFDSTIDWPKAVIWSPDWVTAKGPVSLEYEQVISIFKEKKELHARLERFAWIDGWSAQPKPYPPSIYAFQIYYFDSNHEVIFKHRFYSQYSWYAGFSASQETIAKLKEKWAT